MMTQHSSVNASQLYENRFCNWDDFDIVICRGLNGKGNSNKVIELKSPEFKKIRRTGSSVSTEIFKQNSCY